MKMALVRKQQNTKSVKAQTIRIKQRDGFRALPIVGDTAPTTDKPECQELHCDYVASTWETITPHKAEQMLNKYNTRNRTLLQSLVDQYAADMRAGNWSFCQEPISFYQDGRLADGQHRLWAIVESGRTQKFLVLRGLRVLDGMNIDTGLKRNLEAACRITGTDPTLTSKLVAACRGIEEGASVHGRYSNALRMSMVNRHRAAGEFAIKHLWGKKIANSATFTAIGRAWYKVQDKDKLMRFCEVLRSGQSNGPHESAAITLRNHLTLATANLASSALWKDTMLRTQYAIKKFMAGQQMLRLQTQTEEMYPL